MSVPTYDTQDRGTALERRTDWTCCTIGRETTGAVHDSNLCPWYGREPRLSLVDALALPDAAWTAYRNRPELWSDPDPQTRRVIRWTPGTHDPAGDSGHRWGSDRGPYAFCAAPRCRLVYSRWDGGRCPDAPADDVLTAALTAARAAIMAGRGVGLWTVVQQLREDGHGDAADRITRELVERAVEAAGRDPELFAQLLGTLRASTRTNAEREDR